MKRISSSRTWWLAQASWCTGGAARAAVALAGHFSWYHLSVLVIYTVGGYLAVRMADRGLK